VRRQLGEDRCRHRDGSGFIVFRFRVDLGAVDLNDGVLDLEAAAFEVDVLDTKP
jgi:hypothetical protein